MTLYLFQRASVKRPILLIFMQITKARVANGFHQKHNRINVSSQLYHTLVRKQGSHFCTRHLLSTTCVWQQCFASRRRRNKERNRANRIISAQMIFHTLYLAMWQARSKSIMTNWHDGPIAHPTMHEGASLKKMPTPFSVIITKDYYCY